MKEKFTQADFAQHLNTTLRVKIDGDNSLQLELEAVTPFPDLTHARGDMERFSIYLRGPLTTLLPQQIYTLEHEQLGQLELFLVPVAQNDKGFQYEAVFSYFK